MASANWALPGPVPNGLPSFLPFGYPPWSGSKTKLQPLYYGDIERYGSTTAITMFCDVDQVGTTNPNNSWRAQLPRRPVHGDIRNHVFWDGHVASRNVNFEGGYR